MPRPELALALLCATGLAQPPHKLVQTGDGSRILLVATGGPPVVHWVWYTPAGVTEDPPGLEGLAHAVARAALLGTDTVGTKDTERERDALLRQDALEQERMRLELVGQPLSLELEEQLTTARAEVQALAEPIAFEQALRQAPSLASVLHEAPEASLLQITLALEGFTTVADLLVQMRERAALRGAHDAFRRLRDELVQGHERDNAELAREELLAQQYHDHPYGRMYHGVTQKPQPLSLAQAQATYRSTHAPARTLHVICGGFAIELVEPLLQRAFARTLLKEPQRAPLPPLREMRVERRSVIPGAAQPSLVLAWRVAQTARRDLLDATVEWLTGSADAYLPRGLRKLGHPYALVAGEAHFPGVRADSLLVFDVENEPGPEHPLLLTEPVLLAMQDLLAKAAKDGPSADDLQRVVALQRARRSGLSASPRDLALDLALRCGLRGEKPVDALQPAPPSANDLRDLLATTISQSRRAIVVLEAAR